MRATVTLGGVTAMEFAATVTRARVADDSWTSTEFHRRVLDHGAARPRARDRYASGRPLRGSPDPALRTGGSREERHPARDRRAPARRVPAIRAHHSDRFVARRHRGPGGGVPGPRHRRAEAGNDSLRPAKRRRPVRAYPA